MIWALVAVIAILVVYIAFKEYIWHNKEIDLVDRALPLTNDDKLRQTVRLTVIEEMEKARPRRGRPKSKKGSEEKVDTSEKPTGGGKTEW